MDEDLSAKLAGYLAGVFGVETVEIAGLARIPGGASRQTYRFRARYTDAGEAQDRALILRRDPEASLIETERTAEFNAYRAFHGLGLAVPEPIALELEGGVLDRPFFIMEQIENCSVGSFLAAEPYGEHRESIGEQFWRSLGRIAGADPDAIGLGTLDGARDAAACWRHEVDRWDAVIAEDALEPQPIARAAIRWLRRHPPPPAQKIAVVHGDYRTGNFLFNERGEIRAILDWEMAHLGDPLEDIGWALDPLWTRDPARPAGLIERERALALWQQESGLAIDPAALRWWEIFASLKGAAIWISAAKEYAEGRNTEAVNAFSGWYCLAYHNKVLADRLGRLAAGEAWA